MNLRIIMADPAGNRTAIVRTPVPAGMKAETAARIMGIRELGAEQVGFETIPVMGGQGRLEMMGGEFCGNAARSYGYLLCREQGEKTKTETVIEISGHTGLLPVYCDPEKGTAYARMPMPERLDYSEEGYPLVIGEGITHMILEETDPDPELVRRLVDRYGSSYEAFGIQFLRGDRLVPVVFVAGAGSLVYESSCGSGSLAAAWYLALKDRGIYMEKEGGEKGRKEKDRKEKEQEGEGRKEKEQKEEGRKEKELRGKEQGGKEQQKKEHEGKEVLRFPESGSLFTFQEPGGEIRVRILSDDRGGLSGYMGGTVRIEQELELSL